MQSKKKPLNELLKTANSAWNYLSDSIERLFFVKDLKDDDKAYVFLQKEN